MPPAACGALATCLAAAAVAFNAPSQRARPRLDKRKHVAPSRGFQTPGPSFHRRAPRCRSFAAMTASPCPRDHARSPQITPDRLRSPQCTLLMYPVLPWPPPAVPYRPPAGPGPSARRAGARTPQPCAWRRCPLCGACKGYPPSPAPDLPRQPSLVGRGFPWPPPAAGRGAGACRRAGAHKGQGAAAAGTPAWKAKGRRARMGRQKGGTPAWEGEAPLGGAAAAAAQPDREPAGPGPGGHRTGPEAEPGGCAAAERQPPRPGRRCGQRPATVARRPLPPPPPRPARAAVPAARPPHA
jgi:hypothetical protein